MVLDRIVSVKEAENNFFSGVAFGAILSLIGIVVGANVFKSNPSMAALMFIIIGAVPFFRKMLFLEELKIEKTSPKEILRSCRKPFKVFFSFYLGITLTYFVLSILPPIPFIGQPYVLFEDQLRVFSGFNGQFLNPQAFFAILSNNIQVVLLTLILSLLYGAGSILVLAWNASTLGVFLATVGAGAIAYIPHATLEFLGFFGAAIAGGLVSVAVEHHEVGTPQFRRLMWDVSFMTLISFGFVVLGAAVESALF